VLEIWEGVKWEAFLIPSFCAGWRLHHLYAFTALQTPSKGQQEEEEVVTEASHPGASLRHIVEVPLLDPAVGCNSCNRSYNEPWTMLISTTELGRKQRTK